jgi:integrase
MGKQTFEKVEGYVGIFTRPSRQAGRIDGQTKADLSYYARWKKDGKTRRDFLGRKSEGMTPAQAANMRAKLTAGVPVDLPSPRASKRAAIEKVKAGFDDESADDYAGIEIDDQPPEYWTLDRIFDAFLAFKGHDYPSKKSDSLRYETHIKDALGNARPEEIGAFKIQAFRNHLKSKKRLAPHRFGHGGLAPGTIENVIELVRRLINFAVANNLCPGAPQKIKRMPVDNQVTEDLTPGQIARLWAACDADPAQDTGDMIKLALCTGLRRQSLFSLAWQNINFQKEIITIKSIEHGRHSKSGKQIILPMSAEAKKILKARSATADINFSPYVFPGQNGKMRKSARIARRILRAAGLPDNFRPFHGLRHAFASNLANTGRVDLNQIGRLLGHSPKSTQITQRYAHIRDDALKTASGLMADIISAAQKSAQDQEKKAS